VILRREVKKNLSKIHRRTHQPQAILSKLQPIDGHVDIVSAAGSVKFPGNVRIAAQLSDLLLKQIKKILKRAVVFPLPDRVEIQSDQGSEDLLQLIASDYPLLGEHHRVSEVDLMIGVEKIYLRVGKAIGEDVVLVTLSGKFFGGGFFWHGHTAKYKNARSVNSNAPGLVEWD